MSLLIYAITMICPDLKYALSIVSQYCTNFNSTHIIIIVKILIYMHNILYYSLSYIKSQLEFVKYTHPKKTSVINR